MKIITGTEVGNNVNKNNADHAILFEAINLVIHYKDKAFEMLRKDILVLLGRFISVSESNIRYLALETMAKLSHNEVISSYLISKHLNTILYSLRDKDTSIRRRALDLIFVLCDQESATNVVNELLAYLDENDYALKEELVLKIAILAEKFALNLNWYVDVVIKLIELAGDYVSEEIRFRVVQILTGFGDGEPNSELQKYASLQIFTSLQKPAIHETMVKLGASVLPEFGHHISDAPGKSVEDQYKVLKIHFPTASAKTKAMILTSYVKFCKYDTSLIPRVLPTIISFKTYWDEDIQQRAVEYEQLLARQDEAEIVDLFNTIFEDLPTYPDQMQTNSVLMRRMGELKNEKGFTVNKQEGDDNKATEKQHSDSFRSSVSTALSAKKAEDEFGMEKVSTTEEEGGGLDLLDFEAGVAFDHEFSRVHPGDFAPSQTVNIESETSKIVNEDNQFWKKMIPGNMKEGTIYEDSGVEVKGKFNFAKYDGKIIIELHTKGDDLSDIKVSSKIPPSLKMQISDVMYPNLPIDAPKVMVRAIQMEPLTESPKIAFRFSQGGSQRTIAFAMPILINKYTEPIEMPQGKFETVWTDITNNHPTFQKADITLPNPAPSTVSKEDVLKKMASLLSQCMNLKVLPPQSASFSKIQAVGQVTIAKENLQGYPKNPDDQPGYTIPVMVECEFYPELGLDEFRFSFRSSDKKRIAAPVIELFRFYVCK